MEFSIARLKNGGEQLSAVVVSLHPLVIMNISEHATRMRAQNRINQYVPIYGAVLGNQSGRHIELKNSFEMKCKEELRGYPVIDKEYLERRFEQYQQVFDGLELLGWYGTDQEWPTSADLELRRQFYDFCVSPLLVKLDPVACSSSRLPLAVYESVLVEADWTLTQWHPVTWSFASEQVERISIENVAQISVPSSNSGALTNKQIAGQLSAISMLQDRLELLYDFLMAVQNGVLWRDEALIRSITQLVRTLPIMESENFFEEFNNQNLEVKMTSCVAALTNACGLLHELTTKMNIMMTSEVQVPSGRWSKRSRPLPTV